MINIICWKWGAFKGFRTTFTSYNVNVLYDMVKRNTTIPFSFTCITDDASGIYPEINILSIWEEHKDIKNPNNPKKPSCYRRLMAFSKDFPLGGRIVSMDLDCVVVGNIDSILLREEDFICLEGSANNTPYNGGLWSLKSGSRPQVWDNFDAETSPQRTKALGFVGSDQGWISYILGGGEAVFTKKDGVYIFRERFMKSREKKLPNNAKIIMFPGRIDPWSAPIKNKYNWIGEHYRLESEPVSIKKNSPPVEKQKIVPRSNEITCITFLWGNYPYTATYVNRLFNAIDRHLSFPHRNVCFTNIPQGIREGIEIKPLHNEWMMGNLKKTIQFAPDSGLTGRVLSFDLDNVILGSLDLYAKYTDEFMICEAVNLRRRGKCGGNFMAFDAGYGKALWKELNRSYKKYENITKGSERLLFDRLVKKMKFWPKETIVSYKQHVRTKKVEDWSKVKIIWCHGDPQLHTIKDKIIVDNWV